MDKKGHGLLTAFAYAAIFRSDFLSLPFQAIECSLAGVKPKGKALILTMTVFLFLSLSLAHSLTVSYPFTTFPSLLHLSYIHTLSQTHTHTHFVTHLLVHEDIRALLCPLLTSCHTVLCSEIHITSTGITILAFFCLVVYISCVVI